MLLLEEKKWIRLKKELSDQKYKELEFEYELKKIKISDLIINFDKLFSGNSHFFQDIEVILNRMGKWNIPEMKKIHNELDRHSALIEINIFFRRYLYSEHALLIIGLFVMLGFGVQSLIFHKSLSILIVISPILWIVGDLVIHLDRNWKRYEEIIHSYFLYSLVVVCFFMIIYDAVIVYQILIGKRLFDPDLYGWLFILVVMPLITNCSFVFITPSEIATFYPLALINRIYTNKTEYKNWRLDIFHAIMITKAIIIKKSIKLGIK